MGADQGNVYARYILGRHHENGKGVPKNFEEAMKWYRMAADQGNAFAQYSLGWRYENGEGVPQNLEEAVKWYRLSADQGNESAQTAFKRLGKIKKEPERQ